MRIDTLSMTITLPERKVEEIVSLCEKMLTKESLSLRQMSQLIGKLYATSPAIVQAPLQLRFLQQDLINAQREGLSYSDSLEISKDSRVELEWWIVNLRIQKGKPVLIQEPDLVLFSDAAKTGGWGAAMEGGPSTGGQWSKEEKSLHINSLELMAAELAIKSFAKVKPAASTYHIWIDNQTALSYLVKMGGTKSKQLTEISKRIWAFLLEKEITLTAGWIPSALNWRADQESRKPTNSGDWLLLPSIFLKITQRWGTPTVDCFASRIMKQISAYMSLQLDPESKGTNALYQPWDREFPYLFPPFCLIGCCLRKILQEKVEKAILVVPLWSGQPWFPALLEVCADHPVLLPNCENLLTNAERQQHPLVRNQSLKLGAFLVSGKGSRTSAYQKELLPFCWPQSVKVRQPFTQAIGTSGVLGAVKGRQVPLLAI
jgi:hypothetical protein